jgi:hypothetical protein
VKKVSILVTSDSSPFLLWILIRPYLTIVWELNSILYLKYSFGFGASTFEKHIKILFEKKAVFKPGLPK